MDSNPAESALLEAILSLPISDQFGLRKSDDSVVDTRRSSFLDLLRRGHIVFAKPFCDVPSHF
jgi:hypothetical protein